MMKQIVLGDKLDIHHLAEIKTGLDEYLNEVEMSIDASCVENVDSVGAQLLYSFIKTGHQQGHYICITNPSIAFTQASEILGLHDEFNLADNTHD